jgi:hypothetical protein
MKIPHHRNWTNSAGELTKLKAGRSGKQGSNSSLENVLLQTGAWDPHIWRIPMCFPCRQRSRSFHLTTHLFLVPKIRMCGSCAPRSPVCIHKATLNYSNRHFICAFLHQNTVFRVLSHILHGCDNASPWLSNPPSGSEDMAMAAGVTTLIRLRRT